MNAPNGDDASNSATCSCTERPGSGDRMAKWTTAGGLLAALGACAACCLLPFPLISVGVASAWVSALGSLATYKWIFIVTAAALLGYGFYAAYAAPKRSDIADAGCKACGSRRSIRLGLWVATILVVAGIAFEQIEPYLRG